MWSYCKPTEGSASSGSVTGSGRHDFAGQVSGLFSSPLVGEDAGLGGEAASVQHPHRA
jgi:hypothetical protein